MARFPTDLTHSDNPHHPSSCYIAPARPSQHRTVVQPNVPSIRANFRLRQSFSQLVPVMFLPANAQIWSAAHPVFRTATCRFICSNIGL